MVPVLCCCQRRICDKLLSTIVNKCVQPAELGRGPTKSMCRCAKRRRGTGICSGCNFTCRCIFPSWQPMQARAAAAMSLPILGQQKDALTSLVVALTPGWCTLCRRRMTSCRKAGGRSGRNVPVEMSPRRSEVKESWTLQPPQSMSAGLRQQLENPSATGLVGAAGCRRRLRRGSLALAERQVCWHGVRADKIRRRLARF